MLSFRAKMFKDFAPFQDSYWLFGFILTSYIYNIFFQYTFIVELNF